MLPSGHVRTQALFDGAVFYDWLTVTADPRKGSCLLTEFHREQLDDSLLQRFTQKPITGLAPEDWIVIHVCEAKLYHQKVSRAEAIGYITRLLKAHREKKLQYDLTLTLAETLGAIGLFLIDDKTSDEEIAQWFDQAIIFATTMAALKLKSQAAGVKLLNEVGAPNGWEVIHIFDKNQANS